MNKNLIVRTILATVMMGASAASMAAANQVGTHTATISGSFVSPTCTVTEWPQDISFDPISVADWGKYAAQQVVQSKAQGRFALSGCPANTAVKYSVSVPNIAEGNSYQALAVAADGEKLNGFGVRFSATSDFAGVWKVDGTEANLGRTDAQGQLTVPAYAQIVKRGNLTKGNGPWTGGNFSVVATYNVSYD
ncbi:hypothetical protein STT07_003661 [Cronobacter sakazakii]|nr:hypothetical protein [Cronobacter sakazakii]